MPPRRNGLALAIADGIIRAHGDHLWVESIIGEGSTFFIVLRAVRLGALPVLPNSPTTSAPAH